MDRTNRLRFLPATVLAGLLASAAWIGAPAFASSSPAGLHASALRGAPAAQQTNAKPTKAYCRKHPTDPRCQNPGQ
ncbi:MAG: hypothetical protein B7Z66_07115 [Chromatiales bacterium 21-64-14]|nr:MAG: hypothetical protein B7Z66_07115 [Chromatiales bacterium 21-64-14]HQU16588.1 hypothetical protein [Gammaproteobacteria bacterium]